MRKAIYRHDGHVLGRCKKCGRDSYVEPHGTTAPCKCSEGWTEHSPIPYAERDASGCWQVSRPRRKKP